MQAGSLNQRVTLERDEVATDDWGGVIHAWVTHAELWANVRHLSGSQSIRADSPVSEVRASIRVRYRTDLDASMRVLVGGKAYTVEAVMPNLQSREHIDLVCKLVE